MATERARSENPFVFDRPLGAAEDLVARDEELADLTDAIESGADALIEGPPRHGKTSLANAALAEFSTAGGGLAVRIDCAGVLTSADFVRRLEEAFARAWAQGPVEQALVERLEGVPFRLADAGEQQATDSRLKALLAIPGEVAEETGRRAVISFDDVQDALAIPGLVDAIQTNDEARLARIFTGADLSSRDPVLWGAGTRSVTVGTIEPIFFATAIIQRFGATGRDAGEAARAVSILGAGHPQRTSLIAAQLWELTPEGERATVVAAHEALERALARCTPEFETRWEALHGNERRVAVAIASDLAPQGTRAQRATGLAGFGAAQRALQGITSSGVARQRDDRVTLTDPLFAEWLRRRYVQFPAEPDWQAMRQRERERGMERRGTERET